MPRPANSDARRRLLDAGLALLHRNGFNAAGVKDLVDAAGVPKGSFYAYFSSKEQYACSLVTEYWERIERAHASVLGDESIEPVQRLVAFFRALTDDHAGRDFVVGCLIGNLTLELAATSGAVRATIAELVDRWQRLTVDCLEQARDSGALAGDRDLQQVAELLIEAWEGAVLRGKLERSRRAYERFENVTLPLLVG